MGESRLHITRAAAWPGRPRSSGCRSAWVGVGVRAGVGRSLVRSPAMPVKAQRCRIVAEPAIRGLEDDLRQMLYGFARVHLATGCEDRRDVDAFGVSLEHAVGEEHD